MWWCIQKKTFSIVGLIYLMQILLKVEGFYIKSDYEQLDYNRDNQATACVPMKLIEDSSQEPYYMCQGPPIQYNEPPKFLRASAEYFTHFHNPREINGADGGNYQHVQQLLAAQPGNTFQKMPEQQFPLKFPNYQEHSQNISPHEIDQYSFPVDNSPSHQHNTAAQADLRSVNSACSPYYSEISYETKPRSAILVSSKTNNALATGRNFLNNESVSVRENAQLLPTVNAVKHNINSKQFNAMLEDEVLGFPKLSLSHDDMMPLQNIHSTTKPDVPLPTQWSFIPPEYFYDPILKTFYHSRGLYVPQLTQQFNAVASRSFLPPESYPHFNAPGHLGATATFTNNNKCPNDQHLFFATPQIGPTCHDEWPNKQLTACGHAKTAEMYTAESSQRAQPRVSSENLPMEDLPNKNATLPEVKPNFSQLPAHSTPDQPSPLKGSESFGEDLFAEDTTTKTENTADNKEATTITNTTLKPHTTVGTFKTIIDAAKMHAKNLYGNTSSKPVQQGQIKRDVRPLESIAGKLEKQYIKELDKHF